MSGMIEKLKAAAGEFEGAARDLRADGVYGCCAGTYEHAAAVIRSAIDGDPGAAPGMAALAPPPQLLCKLGSIAIHARELSSPDGHPFDKVALESLLNDRDVKAWLEEMDAAALLPRERLRRD